MSRHQTRKCCTSLQLAAPSVSEMHAQCCVQVLHAEQSLLMHVVPPRQACADKRRGRCCWCLCLLLQGAGSVKAISWIAELQDKKQPVN